MRCRANITSRLTIQVNGKRDSSLYITQYDHVLQVWIRLSQEYSTECGGDTCRRASGCGSTLHSSGKSLRQACD